MAKLCWCQIRSPDSAHKPKQVTLIKKCTEVPQSPLGSKLLSNVILFGLRDAVDKVLREEQRGFRKER